MSFALNIGVLSACTGDNPLAKTCGLSLRTGGQTSILETRRLRFLTRALLLGLRFVYFSPALRGETPSQDV